MFSSSSVSLPLSPLGSGVERPGVRGSGRLVALGAATSPLPAPGHRPAPPRPGPSCCCVCFDISVYRDFCYVSGMTNGAVLALSQVFFYKVGLLSGKDHIILSCIQLAIYLSIIDNTLCYKSCLSSWMVLRHRGPMQTHQVKLRSLISWANFSYDDRVITYTTVLASS